MTTNDFTSSAASLAVATRCCTSSGLHLEAMNCQIGKQDKTFKSNSGTILKGQLLACALIATYDNEEVRKSSPQMVLLTSPRLAHACLSASRDLAQCRSSECCVKRTVLGEKLEWIGYRCFLAYDTHEPIRTVWGRVDSDKLEWAQQISFCPSLPTVADIPSTVEAEDMPDQNTARGGLPI